MRDRRTLLMVLRQSVAIGPLVLLLISALVAGIEQRAEEREVVVAGIEHAPTLRNYIERQTYTMREARTRLRSAAEKPARSATRCWWSARTSRPSWRAARRRVVEIVVEQSATSARRAGVGRRAAAAARLQQRAGARCAWPGAAWRRRAARSVEIEERDLANPQRARPAQLAAMLPFFVLMAVLYGALNAALDTTAGERERGSLEPLLMNPPRAAALVDRQMGGGGRPWAC